jgi:hypothetical protein
VLQYFKRFHNEWFLIGSFEAANPARNPQPVSHTVRSDRYARENGTVGVIHRPLVTATLVLDERRTKTVIDIVRPESTFPHLAVRFQQVLHGGSFQFTLRLHTVRFSGKTDFENLAENLFHNTENLID